MTAENYTLNAGFIDGFGCKGKETMQFSGMYFIAIKIKYMKHF